MASKRAIELAKQIMGYQWIGTPETGGYTIIRRSADGRLTETEAASLIDQAIADAANPYKEAFEELVKAYGIQPHTVFDNEVFFKVCTTIHYRVAPLTRALLTKEEKSE